MKKPIHKLIGYTEDQYENLIFKMMLTWADLYSKGSLPKMQTLMANRQINNWFHVEFRKLIALFRTDLAGAESSYKTTSKDRCHLFVVTATKIYDIYPKALMTAVKVSEINTDKKFSNN
jgi:hypothetical protein